MVLQDLTGKRFGRLVVIGRAPTVKRNKNGTANQEVKQLAEMLQDEVEKQMPWFDREFLAKVMI